MVQKVAMDGPMSAHSTNCSLCHWRPVARHVSSPLASHSCCLSIALDVHRPMESLYPHLAHRATSSGQQGERADQPPRTLVQQSAPMDRSLHPSHLILLQRRLLPRPNHPLVYFAAQFAHAVITYLETTTQNYSNKRDYMIAERA